MVIKIFAYVLALLFLIYCSQWLFNHVDACMGIALGVITAAVTLQLIYTQIKKQIDK